MELLERIKSGYRKRNMRRAIHSLRDLARVESDNQRFSKETNLLWEIVCILSGFYLEYLFVGNPSKTTNADTVLSDWHLEEHYRLVIEKDLVSFYYWLLLYFVLLFRKTDSFRFPLTDSTRAVVGKTKQLSEMHTLIEKWTETLYLVGSGRPDEWSQPWQGLLPLEYCRELYTAITRHLGLSDDSSMLAAQLEGFYGQTEAHLEHSLLELSSSIIQENE